MPRPYIEIRKIDFDSGTNKILFTLECSDLDFARTKYSEIEWDWQNTNFEDVAYEANLYDVDRNCLGAKFITVEEMERLSGINKLETLLGEKRAIATEEGWWQEFWNGMLLPGGIIPDNALELWEKFRAERMGN